MGSGVGFLFLVCPLGSQVTGLEGVASMSVKVLGPAREELVQPIVDCFDFGGRFWVRREARDFGGCVGGY